MAIKNSGSNSVDGAPDRSIGMESGEIQLFGDTIPLSPNHAVFIYDHVALELKYARGFDMLGFDDQSLTLGDIGITATPQQRQACSEISEKALLIAKTRLLEPIKNGIVINYAGQTVSGEKLHLMFESCVFELDEQGYLISTIATVTKLSHLPVPKIVRWNAFGDISGHLFDCVDEKLVQPNRISNREIAVLINMAEGKTMVETAAKLFISPRTVEQHILNLRTRFNCANIGQLIAFGKDMDLI